MPWPDVLVFDSDGDNLADGGEVVMGTAPSNPDSDADTIPDDIDPLPLDPGGTMQYIEAELRGLCAVIKSLLQYL
jgi:hypothetical protein